MSLFAVVMAGGKGTRFWPYSLSSKPKQYLSLFGDKSLLAQTLNRLDAIIDSSSRFIVTVKEQQKLAEHESQGMIHPKGLIFEPEGRNTAPCVLLALAHILVHAAKEKSSLETVVALLPSDHVILNEKKFCSTLELAVKTAKEKSAIVTIGIKPNFPHTGYGYIKARGMDTTAQVHQVDSFKEKPKLEVAAQYLRDGNYFWNAGMFVGQIGVFLEEFKKHAPAMHDFFSPLMQALKEGGNIAEIYGKIPKDSLDYAIMEKSSRVMVVEAMFDWNDLGSWDALESVCEKKGENVIEKARGQYTQNSQGNIVFAPGKFVALINVNDLAIVDSPSALLVLPKNDSQSVKKVVEFLEGKKEFKDLL